MIPQWLKTYYGKDCEVLNPTVTIDGKKYAVVKLKHHGKFGYVLVMKNGRHNSTPITSLFEGIPTADDMVRMRKKLEEAEKD